MTGNKTKILSFDPRIGWACIEKHDNRFKVIDFGTFSKTFLPSELKPDKKFIKFNTLWTIYMSEEIEKLLLKHDPDYVISEDVFAEKFRTTAYAVLYNWVETLSIVLYRVKKKSLFTLSPKRVKLLFTGSGNADKAFMKKTLFERKDIKIEKTRIDELTEHSIDAIGVGVAWLTEKAELDKKNKLY